MLATTLLGESLGIYRKRKISSFKATLILAVFSLSTAGRGTVSWPPNLAQRIVPEHLICLQWWVVGSNFSLPTLLISTPCQTSYWHTSERHIKLPTHCQITCLSHPPLSPAWITTLATRLNYSWSFILFIQAMTFNSYLSCMFRLTTTPIHNCHFQTSCHSQFVIKLLSTLYP